MIHFWHNLLCVLSLRKSADFCRSLKTFTRSQDSMDLMQDSTHTMSGLNARLKGFLEQVNRLQDVNRRLETQITDWGTRRSLRSQDWSQQEQTVRELRNQVRPLRLRSFQIHSGLFQIVGAGQGQVHKTHYSVISCSYNASASGHLCLCKTETGVH